MSMYDLMLESARHCQLDRGSQSISWSKNGFICYAFPASLGHNLNMTFLENTNGANWLLADPHKLTIKPLENSALPNIQLVLWSNILTDLAIFDEHGNFYVLLAGVGLLRSKNQKDDQVTANSSYNNGTLNKVSTAGSASSNTQDCETTEGPSYELTSYNHAEMIYRDIVQPNVGAEGDWRCVAFEWLGIDKPQIINKPAKATEDRATYTYGVHLFQSPLLAHPIVTKQACVALRRNGMFSLFHQGEHKVEYHKVSLNLTPNGGEEAVKYTHASIGFTPDKKILITAYEAITEKILTFLVSVDWGFLKESAVRQKSDPQYYTPKDKKNPPQIHASLLHEMSPLPSIQAEMETQGKNTQFEQCRLSLIDVISPYHLPDSSLDILLSYDVIAADNSIYSTIHRFQVKEADQLLSISFSSMTGTESNSKRRVSTLAFQDRYSLPYKLKAICTAVSGSIMLFVGEDSTITPINRENWSLLELEISGVKLENQEHNKPVLINSLLDCGFVIPRLQNDCAPFVFAVSPNLTGIVHLTIGSGEPAVFTTLERRSNALDKKAICLAFSHTHAQACYSNTSSDDLMALILKEYESLADCQARQELIHDIIVESHSAINFQLNSFNKESVDKLLSNPPLQKLLSLQLTMSDLSKKKVTGDIAWIILGLRSTSFGIMFSLSSIYRQMSKKKPVEDNMDDSINRAECIILLVGSVKWFIDLLIYLNQELLQLAFSKNNPQQSLITIENSVALPILMSKVPRLFLMYAITSIGKTHEILKKLHKDLSESNKLFTPMKEALERFFNTSNYLPLKLSNFEAFLRECDDYISKEHTSKGIDRAALLHFEQQLFCDGKIPHEMLSIAHTIIDRFFANNSRDPRLSSLFFYDTRWLEVGPTNIGVKVRARGPRKNFEPTHVRLQYSETEAIDALRKVFISCNTPIESGGTSLMGQYFNSTYRLKKCVRCRSVSLVSDPLVFESPRTIGLWTMVFQRNCVCGSAWVNCST
ncbi:hypothetical protein METBIDRAFT_230170 [Metschnikowia bicuspidata var. bicuspidata NRRL YB-4993]|uniref:Mediator of RNA polymerase II transcription subunit 16 n=1 Tax=Metschnikowia bicuspidata var. bicuspidata NRRL YB-4993 TaxID=869754 RepID=A0A1A0H990_9ASCO|nr:hypothetical protein METBIDRAFT_230170 [Metschnikowia bicuspidata var. bicuspidata NRRL YB-4993]OBA20586.1 hypothetical protein METBIDRAFT_230170 [Metschnikowia bicuspidata var. bicuspidata NRRL YB-4993]